MDVRATYEAGHSRGAREAERLEGRARTIATARLVLAVIAVGLVVGFVWGKLGGAAWGALGVDAALFVVLVFVHARVHRAKDRASAEMRFYERGLARLDRAWDRLRTGPSADAEHPFAKDLDVFGRASVMQLVDSTETRFGEERLAKLLSLEEPGTWPDEVEARQRAVRDLATREGFRVALATAGGVASDDRPDVKPLLRWAEEKEAPPAALAVLGWLLPAVTILVAVFGGSLGLRPGVVTLVVCIQLAIGVAVSTRLSAMLEPVSAFASAASSWRAMLALVEAESFEAPRLAVQRERLVAEKRRASQEIAALERIVGFVDARRNEVFRFLIGPLLMWDVHGAFALHRWRSRAGRGVRAWLEALGEIEALASLASFAFEHPDFAWPALASDPMLDARSLGHPLLPDGRRVCNDVRLPGPGHALVVTGSNMSGKSTFLRALGVNALLAYAGAPVCASSLRIGPARVATSMRVDDSLEQGVSHFYAELRRLKRVLDLASQPSGPSVLFLLDEILHGTNSRERVLGACAVLRELVQRSALGAVSTHDLGITALEKELGGHVENAHFEEQIEHDTMTFDYVLRPGIVQSSNALRLMRAVGISVPE